MVQPNRPQKQFLRRGRDILVPTPCADGVIRGVYAPKYLAPNCYDCYYYDFGLANEEAKEFTPLCMLLSIRLPKRIRIEDMCKACQNFRIVAITKEYNSHVHGSPSDFCKKWPDV